MISGVDAIPRLAQSTDILRLPESSAAVALRHEPAQAKSRLLAI
jgi:hypothetical protein